MQFKNKQKNESILNLKTIPDTNEYFSFVFHNFHFIYSIIQFKIFIFYTFIFCYTNFSNERKQLIYE